MAIGISLMFGIFLPLNFNSPYKATSIIDFWRRWHMTLSQFLRDYLYIPLGGNRRGRVLRYVNLMITMLLGGLWHGAAWTFVVWGALHGAYLCINHAWNNYGPTIAPRFAPLADIAGVRPDVPRRRRRLGVLPRRQHGIGALRAVEDGRSRPTSPSAAARSPTPLFIVDLCRARLVRAEHAGDHGLRSQRTGRVGEKLARVADAAAVPLCDAPPCWPSGFSESSSTANSSISGSDERTVQESASVSVRERGHHPVGRRRSISSSIRCSCSGRRGFSPRCIRTDSRMQNAGLIRSQRFDTVFMGTSLAIHFRQSDIDRVARRPLAEAVDDRARTRTNRVLCWRRRSSVIRSG